MAWEFVGQISPSFSWQYTPPIEGEFFRLIHTFSDYPAEYFYGQIAQLQINEDGSQDFADLQSMKASNENRVLRFAKPGCFSDRRLAIRRPHVELPTLSGRIYVWDVRIEVSDYTPTVNQVVYI